MYLALGLALFLASAQSAPDRLSPGQRTLPQCSSGRSDSERGTTSTFNADGRLDILQRRLFAESPQMGHAYGFFEKSFRSIWASGQPFPVIVTRPGTADGFVKVGLATEAMEAELFALLSKEPTVVLAKSPSRALLIVDVGDVIAAPVGRSEKLESQVSLRAQVLEPRCIDGDDVHMSDRQFEQEIHQLCDTAGECAKQVAAVVVQWFRLNF